MLREPRIATTQKAPITFYATPWCGDCRLAKRWFDEQGIAYDYINIDQDEQAAREVLHLNGGMRSVPTIVFPDGSILVEPSTRQLAAKYASLMQQSVNTTLQKPDRSSAREVLPPYQYRKQGNAMNTTTRFLVIGAIAGMVAGVMMAMYAMIASTTFLGQGFFTPLYGIASPLLGPGAMMQSMKAGIYFTAGPALLGLIFHMLWSALYGMLFALLVLFLRLRGMMALLAGLVYGLVVLLIMSFIVLPIVGAATMPTTIGWPSFIVEHLIFGMVLGLWFLARSGTVSRVTARPA